MQGSKTEERKPGPLLLNTREAARTLSISPRTLWDLTKSGEIECIRIGRSVRYSVEQLRQWVHARQADNKDEKKTQ